jgi:hypothetical protein
MSYAVDAGEYSNVLFHTVIFVNVTLIIVLLVSTHTPAASASPNTLRAVLLITSLSIPITQYAPKHAHTRACARHTHPFMICIGPCRPTAYNAP